MKWWIIYWNLVGKCIKFYVVPKIWGLLISSVRDNCTKGIIKDYMILRWDVSCFKVQDKGGITGVNSTKAKKDTAPWDGVSSMISWLDFSMRYYKFSSLRNICGCFLQFLDWKCQIMDDNRQQQYRWRFSINGHISYYWNRLRSSDFAGNILITVALYFLCFDLN